MSNTSNQCTIELAVTVTYSLNGESPDAMSSNLQHMVVQAIGNGMLTGSSDAEVETYSLSTKVIPPAPVESISLPAASATTAEGLDAATGMAIEATLSSDDQIAQATFDALEYFKQANTRTLRELVDCGFGGDYPADMVAEFFQGKNHDVDDVFGYLESIRGLRSKKNACGFECHVNPEQAIAWLKENHRDALSSLPIGDWRTSLKKGDQVYWKDPDGDLSSGYYNIMGIYDDNEVVSFDDTLLILSNEGGSVAEVYANEILQAKPARKMRP